MTVAGHQPAAACYQGGRHFRIPWGAFKTMGMVFFHIGLGRVEIKHFRIPWGAFKTMGIVFNARVPHLKFLRAPFFP